MGVEFEIDAGTLAHRELLLIPGHTSWHMQRAPGYTPRFFASERVFGCAFYPSSFGVGAGKQACGHRTSLRAGDRDRTGMASLEGWGSAIELHPRGAPVLPDVLIMPDVPVQLPSRVRSGASRTVGVVRPSTRRRGSRPIRPGAGWRPAPARAPSRGSPPRAVRRQESTC